MVPYALCDLDDHFVDNNQSRGYFRITLVVHFIGEQLKITIRIQNNFLYLNRLSGLLFTLIETKIMIFIAIFPQPVLISLKRHKKENSTTPISDCGFYSFEILQPNIFKK